MVFKAMSYLDSGVVICASAHVEVKREGQRTLRDLEHHPSTLRPKA